MSKISPIVLFTYNRPEYTKQTMQALIANPLAKDSELFIYQDAPKLDATDDQIASVQAVKDYIKTIITANPKYSYFKNITLIERTYNYGLADSIISGVSDIMKSHSKAIVLEDDIITSPVFLDYMNEGLRRYESQSKVWSISAWSYPIDSSGLGDSYFWRSPHCWGWASWADRWQYFKRDIQWALNNFSKQDIDYINIGGSAHFFDQLIANHKGTIKTWAIFNYLIAYKHSALTLCPSVAYIKQNGFDGSGVHCNSDNDVFNHSLLNTKFPIDYPQEIQESSLAYERIKAFELSLKKPLHNRILNKLLKIINSIKTNGGGAYQHDEIVFLVLIVLYYHILTHSRFSIYTNPLPRNKEKQ